MNKSTKFYDSWPKNIAHRTPIKQPVKHESWQNLSIAV